MFPTFSVSLHFSNFCKRLICLCAKVSKFVFWFSKLGLEYLSLSLHSLQQSHLLPQMLDVGSSYLSVFISVNFPKFLVISGDVVALTGGTAAGAVDS